MKKDTFTLKKTEEFIELNQLLKLKQLVQSGGHAKIVIDDGMVMVNGEKESRKRRKLRAGDIVQYEETQVEIKA